jgi:hypothetical protein
MKRLFQNRRGFYLVVLILAACVILLYLTAYGTKSESTISVKSEPARLRAQKKKCECCKKLSSFKKEFEARQAKRKLEDESNDNNISPK